MKQSCAVVLAAGRARRMGFNKLLGRISGHPMVWYPITHLRNAGLSRILVVVGHQKHKVQAAIKNKVEFIFQERQKGTGHAAATIIPYLRDEKNIIILFGDCPFLDTEIIQQTFTNHLETKAGITIATAKMREPQFLGQIKRKKDGTVKKIVDGLHCHNMSGGPSEIFAGLSVWNADIFKNILLQLPEKHRKEDLIEQDLPDAIEIYVNNKGKVSTFSDITEDDALGPNTPNDFHKATAYLRVKVATRLMLNEVIIPDLDKVTIDYDVSVRPNTEIHSNTHLFGTTQIGQNCKIGPDTTLTDCIVGNNCIIGKGAWKNQNFVDNSHASDSLATDHRHFRKPPSLIPEDPRFSFVLMPFKQPYLDLMDNVIRPTLNSRGFDCKIASDNFGPGIVIDEIWLEINRSRFVVAEISEPNRNVWYELGLAHALNKPVIMLSKPFADRTNFPFDIKHHRVLLYEPDKGNLATLLKKWIDSVVLK